MKNLFFCLLAMPVWLGAQPLPGHNLEFGNLPARWDEGLPLGNGWLGCLVWQRDGKIRFALDRADLWDLRPMHGLDRPEFRYHWVAQQVANDAYGLVQTYFDEPYEREAGPTKLPGAALEFVFKNGDTASQSGLDLHTGLATVRFSNGLRLRSFVHATRNEGWFRIDFAGDRPSESSGAFPSIELLPPQYGGDSMPAASGSVSGDTPARLGYRQGKVATKGPGHGSGCGNCPQTLVYTQPCWPGQSYQVAVSWVFQSGGIEGVWSISRHLTRQANRKTAENSTIRALKRGFESSFRASARWWASYWAKSSIQIPDTLMERQYYRELYKFGCVARANAPMISLQAVWTADNGRLPPWKGDFHHDLNTQMSYWPAYTSNHLDLAQGYLNHLERNVAAHRRFTRRYFGTAGLNVPGVETLEGEPMGGWIQYACSPTTSAWLARHFYQQWSYSQDRRFLKKHAWPWLRDVAVHLEQLSYVDSAGIRVLPLSSSPEINDNSISAWFPNTWTNYDLALAHFVFGAAASGARHLKKNAAARHWEDVRAQLPPFSTDSGGALMFAPTLPYQGSHRHFSHLMAIYPLGLLRPARSSLEQQMIRNSLHLLDSVGTSGWTGYSFAWLANLRAQAHDGAGARDALRIFAEAFVSVNSFHLNGDQSDRQYSSLRYRPFTLEGNFAFASGVLEMLLQSGDGVVEVFPAIPEAWKNIAFQGLRAEGAFLIDAEKRDGVLVSVRVRAEKGGLLKLLLPDDSLAPVLPAGMKSEWGFYTSNDNKRIWIIPLRKGDELLFSQIGF